MVYSIGQGYSIVKLDPKSYFVDNLNKRKPFDLTPKQDNMEFYLGHNDYNIHNNVNGTKIYNGIGSTKIDGLGKGLKGYNELGGQFAFGEKVGENTEVINKNKSHVQVPNSPEADKNLNVSNINGTVSPPPFFLGEE